MGGVEKEGEALKPKIANKYKAAKEGDNMDLNRLLMAELQLSLRLWGCCPGNHYSTLQN